MRGHGLDRSDSGEGQVAESCQQTVNIMHDYTSCSLYRVDTPDDEQQAVSKHVEAYY
jgi:hypothetical protein